MGEDRFFFMHIMKTGGTSFQQQIRRSLDPTRVYPGPAFCDSDEDFRVAKTSTDRLLGPDAPSPEKISLYTVHLPLWTRDALGQDLVTITVLRDPVQRMVSHLRHMARGEMLGRPLEDIYELHGAGMLRNYQVGHFSQTQEEWEETNERRHVWYTRREMGIEPPPAGAALPMDDQRFQRAVDRLDDVDVLATLDDFDRLTTYMTDRFGWAPQGAAIVNAAPVDGTTDQPPVSAALRAKIVSDNELESEFYEIARDASESRLHTS